MHIADYSTLFFSIFTIFLLYHFLVIFYSLINALPLLQKARRTEKAPSDARNYEKKELPRK